MAYGPFFLRHLIALKRRGLLDGYRRVVEIGRQQINDRMIGSPELDEAVALFGGTMPALTPVRRVQIRRHRRRRYPHRSQPRPRAVALSRRVRSRRQYRNDGACRQPRQCLCGDPRSGARRRHDAAPGAGLWAHRPQLLRLSAEIFHRLAKANDYELAEVTLAPQREFELPDYLRGQGLPPSFASAGLTVVMRRRDRRKFVMPLDA